MKVISFTDLVPLLVSIFLFYAGLNSHDSEEFLIQLAVCCTFLWYYSAIKITVTSLKIFA